MDKLYILRCVNALPLRVADALGPAVRVPTVTRRIRLPRRRAFLTRVFPAVPGFVFAREQHPDTRPLGPHAALPPLLISGVPATCHSSELDDMEAAIQAEAESPGWLPPPLPPVGVLVRVSVGPFAGRRGLVTAHSRPHASVDLGGVEVLLPGSSLELL